MFIFEFSNYEDIERLYDDPAYEAARRGIWELTGRPGTTQPTVFQNGQWVSNW
jgi:hypothetical protein